MTSNAVLQDCATKAEAGFSKEHNTNITPPCDYTQIEYCSKDDKEPGLQSVVLSFSSDTNPTQFFLIACVTVFTSLHCYCTTGTCTGRAKPYNEIESTPRIWSLAGLLPSHCFIPELQQLGTQFRSLGWLLNVLPPYHLNVLLPRISYLLGLLTCVHSNSANQTHATPYVCCQQAVRFKGVLQWERNICLWDNHV